MNKRLMEAIESVPAGAWGVGVSGGADSVALLSLLRERADLKLHVLHVDHETRGGESGEDAAFVIELMNRWQLDGAVIRRSLVEKTLKEVPANLSARFRAVRLEFFRREVAARNLQGVILAHHADDQAETVLERLLRGSGFRGLAGMSPRATFGGLVVLRPLLSMRRDALREHLQSIGQSWREDSSNAFSAYLRNRVRRVLMRNESLHDALIELSTTCRALRAWARANAPKLGESFEVRIVQQLPEVLAQESVRAWLSERGVPKGEIGPDVIARLLEMVNDAASAARRHFPGKVLVIRRRGRIACIEC